MKALIFVFSSFYSFSQPYYDSIGEFNEQRFGWVMVETEGLYGFIDFKGKEIVSPKYTKIHGFNEHKFGWTKVEIDEQIGFINSKGKEVVKPK